MQRSASNIEDNKGKPKSANLGLWVVLLLALGVRVAYGIEHTSSPDYSWPSVDAQYHDVWARSAAGLEYNRLPGFVDPELHKTPSLRPAGYPWFLALIYKLSGGSYGAVRFVQHLLGILSVALVWFALRGRVPDWLAGVAAGAFALHFAPLYFEGELQATSLLIFLDLLALTLFVKAFESGGIWRVLLAGLVFGLATLVRPNVLLPAILLGLFLVWKGSASLSGRRAFGVFALGLILGLLPGAARNWARCGEFIPLTATGGINMYLGQGPHANGLIDGNMGELGHFQTCFDYSSVKQHVERRVGHGLSYAELDRWFLGEAVDSMAGDPLRALKLMGVKAALLFGSEEVGHNKEVGMERRGSWALRLLPMPFTALLALLLWGLLARSIGGRKPDQGRGASHVGALFAIHGIWVLGFALSLLPFFAASRYRTPLIPHFVILSALGLAGLVLRGGARNALVITGVTAGCLALLITSIDRRYQGPHAYKYHLDRGMACADQERLPEAQVEFALALEADPGNPAVLGEISKMHLRSGELHEARSGFEAVLAQDPTHPSALYNLGWIAEQQGRWGAALDGYFGAWKSQPTLSLAERALRRLVLQLATHPEAKQRDGAAAVAAMGRWLSVRPATLPDLALLAAAQAEAGDFVSAMETVNGALTRVSETQKNTSVVRGLHSARKRYAKGQPLRMAPKPPRDSRPQTQ